MRFSAAIQLIPALFLAAAASAVEVRTATHLDSYTWQHDADWFGGFSALTLSDDGQSMVILSDRAKLATARIIRSGGNIREVRIDNVWPVRSSRNRILPGWTGDSEGLAAGDNGDFYISFEGVHRVAHYAQPDARARVLPRPPVFRTFEDNGSFEALAIDGQGRLYTLTEKSRTADGHIPVYRWDGSAWSMPFTLPQRGRFRPVASDFGPDGRFYVLERSVSLFGFKSRLRRWQVDEDDVFAEEILFETSARTHDNLEGLSVWRDGQNRLRATMVSDDNFLFLQRTELVEYALPD